MFLERGNAFKMKCVQKVMFWLYSCTSSPDRYSIYYVQPVTTIIYCCLQYRYIRKHLEKEKHGHRTALK